MIIVVDLTEEIMLVIKNNNEVYIIVLNVTNNFYLLGHTIVAGGKKYAFHLLPSGY